MNRREFSVNEGFVLDDAGNIIVTMYIDLRPEGERTAIDGLIKGCKGEFALERGTTILISKPARFREYGEELIQDVQEGYAKDETVTVREETAEEAAKLRAIADLNEARELSNSRMRMVERITFSSKNTESKGLAYGNDWWIFCASMAPDDEDWETWRSSLPRKYDHVSTIGQPAKFAQALARMVSEQIGPQGKIGWFKQTTDGAEAERTEHKVQWVIHGPVVYTDQVFDTVAEAGDGMERLAASIFTKSTKYAAQREYRFAVLGEGAHQETLLLQISGMMRDALERTEGGLVRTPPLLVAAAEDNGPKASPQNSGAQTPTHKRKVTTERQTEWREARWESRTSDGKVMSSEGERQESVKERVVTQEYETDDDASPAIGNSEAIGEIAGAGLPKPQPVQESGTQDWEQSDEEAVQELALEERKWDDDRPERGFTIPVVHRGTGRVYNSIEEALGDPAYPMSPPKETWRESASSPEEVARTLRAIDTLDWKMPNIKQESRQDTASASWYAVLCMRNIHARLGDIVESIWIERERFVVIRLKESDDFNATGRIVIAPTGAYAYCLQLPGKEVSGHGGESWGTMFFPLGGEVDSFKEFGWPEKPD